MLTVENLDPKQYQSYCTIDQSATNAEAYLIRGTEDVIYDEVDFFSFSNKTIVAFKSFDKSNSEFAFKIVLDGISHTIQYESYERIKDLILGEYELENTSFVLMDSVEIPDLVSAGKSLTMHGENRCDMDRIGPVPFVLNDNGLGEELRNPIYHTVDNMITFNAVLSSPKNMHIFKFTWKNYPDEAYKNYTGVVGICRTFGGALKLLTEWNDVSYDPWNSTERISLACRDAVISLNISDQILSSIRDSQADMPVMRYCSGINDARNTDTESKGLPQDVLNWYLSSIRYGSLNCMNTNLNLNLPSSVMQEEKKYFSETLYSFMLENGINPEQTDLLQLIDIINGGTITSNKSNIDSIIFMTERAVHV